MALISLNDLYDKWKKVSDWVTGADAVSAPAFKLTGSNVEGTPASPTPTKAVQIAGKDGANNLQVVRLDVYGNTDANALDGTKPIIGTASAELGFNGSSWDRWRNNTEGTLMASAARTASTNSSVQTNYNARGIMVEIAITTAGTGSLTMILVGTINSNTHILAGSTAITGVGKYLIELYPGIGAAANEVNIRQSGTLPRMWDVRVNHSDASSWTYSVGHSLIL